MNMKARHCFAAGIAVLLAACGSGNSDYDASGVFETTEITVSSQGTGEIRRLDIREGQTVQAGQAVGCIDTVQLHLKRQELLGSLCAAASRRYDVERQVASLRQELATQQRERERYERLVRDRAAGGKQVDDIDARIALLQKQLAAQQETLENGNRGVDGQLAVLRAQLAQVDDQLRRCVVTSPATGTVLAKYAEPGEFATQGRSLFLVGDLAHLYLRAYFTAPQLTELRIGQRVTVLADQGDDGRREYPGTVAWISDKAEFTPKTIQTRDERANLVYAVKVAVENDGYIKRGMYGEVRIDAPQQD